jgi:hypothetical protein
MEVLKIIEFEEKIYMRVMALNFLIALILALIYLILFGVKYFTLEEIFTHVIIFFGAFGFNMYLIGMFFSNKGKSK